MGDVIAIGAILVWATWLPEAPPLALAPPLLIAEVVPPWSLLWPSIVLMCAFVYFC
jgi:hypothetical protein